MGSVSSRGHHPPPFPFGTQSRINLATRRLGDASPLIAQFDMQAWTRQFCLDERQTPAQCGY